MSKISILSMQRIINYGSFLQAYGLKQLLSKINPDISFIDIEDGIYHENSEVKSKKRPKFKRIMRRLRAKYYDKMIEQEIKKYQQNYLNLKDYNTTPSSDCSHVVIGSDEVFNSHPKSSWGLSLQLYGKVTVPHVLSYAASCGYLNQEDIPQKYLKDIGHYLSKMDAISVRDENTFNFVKNISGCTPQYNLDPVLIYDFEDELMATRIPKKIKGKYMIIYSYRNRISDPNEIKSIKDYAKKNGLKIYCIGGVLDWCPNILILNPFQVLNVFKNAECIVTDTFHGTIFSIKYNKRFISIIRESNQNKLLDLLKRLEQESRIVSDPQNLEKVLDVEPNYEKTNKIISEEKKKTEKYLKDNIKIQGEENE